jgi:DNA-binding MarR family transcriptional regulator
MKLTEQQEMAVRALTEKIHEHHDAIVALQAEILTIVQAERRQIFVDQVNDLLNQIGEHSPNE